MRQRTSRLRTFLRLDQRKPHVLQHQHHNSNLCDVAAYTAFQMEAGDQAALLEDQLPRVPLPTKKAHIDLAECFQTQPLSTPWLDLCVPCRRCHPKPARRPTFAARLAMYVCLFRREAAAQHPCRLASMSHHSLEASHARVFSLRSPQPLFPEKGTII